MVYFQDKLIEFLPPIYERSDTRGDLRTFLGIPAETLDELKSLIDNLPELYDVDRCPAKFLPYLGALVGYQYDPVVDHESQRRVIRERIEYYRRRGTIPALLRDLLDEGAEVTLEETYRKVNRLNRRSVLNASKLAGEIYSYGAYILYVIGKYRYLRDVIEEHHPAGTRYFFRPSILSLIEFDVDAVQAVLQRVISRVFARFDHVFELNRDRLNGLGKLTRTRQTDNLVVIGISSGSIFGLEEAAGCFHRWQKIKPGFKLNNSGLNNTRLRNLWFGELTTQYCYPIQVDEPTWDHPVIRLAGQALNRSRLANATAGVKFKFRKRVAARITTMGITAAGNRVRSIQWP